VRSSSFCQEQRVESKRSKTFVANDTVEKNLIPFSIDRKFVVSAGHQKFRQPQPQKQGWWNSINSGPMNQTRVFSGSPQPQVFSAVLSLVLGALQL
jgi:hypothetical protein